jgi:putative ABC transport system ATP-binding protein
MTEVRLEMVSLSGAEAHEEGEADRAAPSNAFTGWRSSPSMGAHSPSAGVASASDAAQRRGGGGAGEEGEDECVVVIDNLHKTYLLGIEGVAALRGVSLTIKRGEFVMLYGTSGGGKSTLLNIIGTIDLPTKGAVTVCGTRVTDSTPDTELAALRLNRLGFVFQTFNLISGMTALENVEMPLTLHGALSSAERRERCTSILRSVGMGDRMHHVPSQLSGGEQQRVTIAR